MTYRTVELEDLLALLSRPKTGEQWKERIDDELRPITEPERKEAVS